MKKFFRVELDKTGAILSCSEVEASEKNGRFVRYVEALDNAGAVEQVKAWWTTIKAANAARSAARRDMLRSAKRCLDCSAAAPNSSYCDSCNELRAARKRDLRAGAPLIRPHSKTAAEASARRKASYAKHVATKGMPIEATYRSCLSHFDKLGPKQYRAWLVGKIAALEAKRLAKQQAAA